MTSVVSIAVGAWFVVNESASCDKCGQYSCWCMVCGLREFTLTSVVSIAVGAWFVVNESASCDKCGQYSCWCMVCGL